MPLSPTFDQVLPTADGQRTAQWALRNSQQLSRISTELLHHSISLYTLATRLGTTFSLLFRHFGDQVLKPHPKKKSALSNEGLALYCSNHETPNKETFIVPHLPFSSLSDQEE